MYNEHGLHIFHFVYGLLHNREEAEDITQETFTGAFRIRENLIENPQVLKMYLFTTARNKSYDRLNQKKKTGQQLPEQAIGDQLHTESIEHAIIKQEVIAELYKTIELLPEEPRKVLKMIYFEGLTITQVAEKLNKKPVTIRNQKQFGLKKLRELLPEWVLVTPVGIWLLHQLEKM